MDDYLAQAPAPSLTGQPPHSMSEREIEALDAEALARKEEALVMSAALGAEMPDLAEVDVIARGARRGHPGGAGPRRRRAALSKGAVARHGRARARRRRDRRAAARGRARARRAGAPRDPDEAPLSTESPPRTADFAWLSGERGAAVDDSKLPEDALNAYAGRAQSFEE